MQLKRKKFFIKIFTVLNGILILYTTLFKPIDYNNNNQASNNSNLHQLFVSTDYLNSTRTKLLEIFSTSCNPEVYKTASECSTSLSKLNDSSIKNNCNECNLKLNSNKGSLVYFHTFWHFENLNVNNSRSKIKFEYQLRVMHLNLMSYLSTQNLCCTRLIIWTLKGFNYQIKTYLSKKLIEYFQNGSVRMNVFNLKSLCQGSSAWFSTHSICKSSNESSRNLSSIRDIVGLSDLVRWIVLDKFTGIYVDGDVIFLRNMNVFWTFNFAYLWGKFKDKLNTAVLGINKHLDPSISQLYNVLLSNRTTLNELVYSFHPMHISKQIYLLNGRSVFNYKPLKVIRNYVFDPAWMCFEKRQKPLNKMSVCRFNEFTNKTFVKPNEFLFENFFPGAYTYHIHGDAGPQVLNTSYFFYLETFFKKKLNI